jgi:hypothetical protein
MIPLTTILQALKTLVRSMADCYILPGTASGTDILWLYLLQWKREASTISLAILSVFVSQIDLPANSASSMRHHATEETESVQSQ